MAPVGLGRRSGHVFFRRKKKEKKKLMKWISARTPKKRLTSLELGGVSQCTAAPNAWNGPLSSPTASDQLSHPEWFVEKSAGQIGRHP